MGLNVQIRVKPYILEVASGLSILNLKKTGCFLQSISVGCCSALLKSRQTF